MQNLVGELSAGGGTLTSVTLGAAHALTPGQGKSALAAYFLGTEARFIKGLRTEVAAAILHVLSGLVALVGLRLVPELLPSVCERPCFVFLRLG